MNYIPNPQYKAFWTLAGRVVGGNATPNEKAELDSLLERNPTYMDWYRELQVEFQQKAKDEVFAISIRTFFGTSSAEDQTKISNWRASVPELFTEHQNHLVNLVKLAKFTEVDATETPKLEMPAHVREKLDAILKAKKPTIKG